MDTGRCRVQSEDTLNALGEPVAPLFDDGETKKKRCA